jgi:flagellar FliJ protein
MNPLQPLLTLLAHVERERDTAMAEAKRVEMDHHAAQLQTERLQSYRREYEQRWGSQFGQGGGIDIVQCYHGFMTRLGQAIDAQERITLQTAQRLEFAQAAWLENEMRMASVRKLIERRGRELRGVADLREQKQLDEHAARLLWNRTAGGGLPAVA